MYILTHRIDGFIFVVIYALLISLVNCLNRLPRNNLISSDYTNYIQYSEIASRLSVFPSSHNRKLNDFNEIAIDYENEFIYIGAKNNLVRLSFKNDSLNLLDTESDIINWEPSLDSLNECKHSHSQTKYCHNYIRIILFNSNKSQLLTCGTNAHKPICTWRSLSNPSKIIDHFDALGKCPQSPETSLSYLKLDNDYYFATSIDYSSIGMRPDYLIERNLDGFIKKQIRTDQYNSNWLNEPQFVASIEIDNYVYFFFKETAIEYMNCGQKIYSRVARVCKYDEGTENFNVWKTFEKARLNCSIPANNYTHYSQFTQTNIYTQFNQQYSYAFDEIQNVFYDKKTQLIYALFSTPINGIKGSAVCVYDVASLEKVFNGPFKHQKTKDSIWEPSTSGDSFEKTNCKQNRSITNKETPRKFQLKHLSVQPIYERPLIVVSNNRLTKLVVDNVITKNQDNIEMLFISTEYNTVLKYMLLNMDATSTSFPTVCLLEEIEVLNVKNQFNLINNLVLLSQNLYESNLSKMRSLLIATSLSLVKMPVANCESQMNYFSCLSLMDPYCIWDSKAQKCLFIFKTNETLYNSNTRLISQNIKANTHLHQHAINSCPTTSQPVDGGFSEWSSWTSCMSKSGERCKCRMRLCNEPTPRNGGKICDDTKAIEILNCEVNGGWTEWSAWSACKGGQATNCEQISASLTSKAHIEPAVRTRTRTCTNPEPKFNGRLCVGQDQEEEICTLEMINPCSLVLNSANVNSLMSASLNLNSNGQWSGWGPWEECSKTCGEGFQMRRRVCNSKLCPGCNQEWRTCNSEPCRERVESIITEWDQIETSKESNQKLEKRLKFSCKYDHYLEANNLDGMELNSSIEYRICENEKFCRSLIWSEWSTCKDCSDIQHRTRKCSVVNTCFGHDRETRDCDCNNSNKQDYGWSCWSDYGPCSSNCGKGVHRRTRKCLTPTLNCFGPKEEISTCFSANCSGIEKNYANEKLFSSISSLTSDDTIGITGILHYPTTGYLFSITHLIITAVMSFLFGSLVVLLTVHLFFKSNNKRSKSILCCCGTSQDSRYAKKPSSCRDTQISSSLDRNSDATDTAVTDLHNSECSKMQYCSSDTSCTSANSNHSKEYFTVGNRFDSNGLSSLLNDIIPDDDDDMLHTGLSVNYTPSNHSTTNSGTLGRSSNSANCNSTSSNNNKNLSKVINQSCLPNKSFNTYSTHKDLSNTLSKNSKALVLNQLNNSSNTAINMNTNRPNNIALTVNTSNGNKFSNFQPNASLRSSNKQPRNSFAFNNLRTNLDQEL